jgi:hypothetical protein
MTNAPREKIVDRINEVLALRITMLVGSIWAFYAFVIFGLTPLLWPEYEEQILYWSNFLQLIFLPVITVGTAILNRDTRAQADEDHQTIRKEFELLQKTHHQFGTELSNINLGLNELLSRSNPLDGDRNAVPNEMNSGDKGNT